MEKTQQALSVTLCILVLISGVYFAYTSLERLMYPTPIWFSVKYLCILILTALAKLGMHFVYKLMNRKAESEIVKIMAYDCILDFFITTVTVISLAVSSLGTFALDAICGLFISGAIIIGAGKLLREHLRKLLGHIPTEKAERIEEIFLKNGIDTEAVSITFIYGEKLTGYVSLADEKDIQKAESLYEEIKSETEITLKTVNN